MRQGKDVENGDRSHFVNIEFRRGRIAKNEVPGCHNSGPEARFRASKKRCLRKRPKLELLKSRFIKKMLERQV